MKKLMNLFALLIIFTYSCKKDDPVECPSEPILNYTPMSIGDYWVYEVFFVDTNGNDSSINRIDSMYVSGDTIINQNTYTIIDGDHFIFGTSRPQILRDSNGYIVDHNGTFIFSPSDFTTPFNAWAQTNNDGDTIMHWYRKMMSGEIQMSTQAGVFSCLRSQIFFYHLMPNMASPRLYPDCYANNVGLVVNTIGYASQPGYYERRLIRYQVTNPTP